MQAARYHGPGDVRVEDVPEQSLTPDGVRVEVAFCGICGTDLGEYVGGPTAIPDEQPHPVTGERAPVTLGHELSGTVTAVGEDVATVAVGDRVVVNPLVVDGDCPYCREGLYRLCENLSNVGLHGNGGGFAENVVVPASNVHVLPEELDLAHAALVEPLAVSLHAVRRSGTSAGDRVAVFGAGPIGLGIVQAARVAGAREVFVSEPLDARRERAADLGADVALDPAEEDVVEAIHGATDIGVDAAFEAAGVDATVDAAVRATRKAGQVVSIAAAEEATIRPNRDFVLTERSFAGSFAYGCVPYSDRGEFGTVIRMLADGRLDAGAMITDRIGLGSVVKAGIERLRDDDDQVKILVSPE